MALVGYGSGTESDEGREEDDNEPCLCTLAAERGHGAPAAGLVDYSHDHDDEHLHRALREQVRCVMLLENITC